MNYFVSIITNSWEFYILDKKEFSEIWNMKKLSEPHRFTEDVYLFRIRMSRFFDRNNNQ